MSESKLPGPKASGIKPPSTSRIGRLCTTGTSGIPGAPKPSQTAKDTTSVPTKDTGSPNSGMVAVKESTDGTKTPDSGVSTSQSMPSGRITEEFCRGPLADVDEECEATSATGLHETDSITGSITGKSNQARKMSNQSVVLTSDTDSFVIGQRVYVGGVRPGQIAYLGETQFAPGEWAGVVLDEANGKNDGCVSGVRYFQCPARRGVFARLTRLTHEPIAVSPSAGADAPLSSSSPLGAGGHSGLPQMTSLTGSRRVSPAVSTASLASRSPGKTPQVGDRVIVQSATTGSKPGVLRYLGETKFANGVWCGVELDEPQGKNDGSVEGHRYFVCPPRHGLFAPAAKVSLSPSSARMRNSGAGLSMLRSTASKESLLSQSVSVASAASRRTAQGRLSSPGTNRHLLPRQSLQDLLREKQHHIEQLLKERELERTEVDQAMVLASQAKKDTEKLKQTILQLQEENASLRQQIDDDAKKAEDLQFNVLEQTICKEDLTSINEAQIALNKSNSDLISSLEQKISEQASLIEQLSHKEQSLNDALSSAHALAKNSGNDSETIATLRAQLEQSQMLLQVIESDKEEKYKSYEESKSKMVSEIESTRKEGLKNLEDMQKKYAQEIETLNIKLAESQQKLLQTLGDTNKDNEIDKLKKMLDDVNKKHLDDVLNLQETLGKENSRLKMEYSAKQADIELLSQNLEMQTEKAKNLENSIAQIQSELKLKNDEIASKTSSGKNIEENLKTELNTLNKLIESLKMENVDKDTIIEDCKKKIEHNNEFSDEKIEYLTKQTDELKKELTIKDEALEKQFLDMKSLENSLKEEIDVYRKELEEKNNVKQILQNEYLQEINGLKQKLTDLENEKQQAVEELQINLDAELTASKISMQELEKQMSDCKMQLTEKENQLLEISGKFKQLEEDNCKKVKENEEVTKQIGELQDIVSQISEKLKKSEADLLEKTNGLSKMELEIGDLQRKLQVSADKLGEVNEEKLKLENDLELSRNTSLDSNSELKRLTDELKVKSTEVTDLKDLLSANKMSFESSEQELKQALSLKEKEFEKGFKEMEEKIKQFCDKEIKMNEIIESQKIENEKMKLSYDEQVTSLKKIYEDKDSERKSTLDGNMNEIVDLKKQLQVLVDEKNKLSTDLESKIKDANLEFAKKNEELVVLQKSFKEYEEIEKKKYDDLVEVNKKLMSDNEEKINGLETVKIDLQKELDVTKANLESVAKKLEQLTNDSSSSNEDLLKKIQEKENAIEKMKIDLEKNNEEYKMKLEDATKISEDRNVLIENMRKEFEQHKEDYKKIMDEKLGSEKKFNELTDSLEKSKKACVDYENLIKTKTEEFEKIIKEKDGMVKLSTDSENEIKDLKTKIQNMEELKKLTDGAIQEHSESLQSLRNEIQLKNETLDKITESKQLLETNLEESKNIIMDLKSKLGDYEKNSESVKIQQTQNLELLNNELREKQEVLKKQADMENKLNCEIAELKNKITELEVKDQENLKLKTRICELEIKEKESAKLETKVLDLETRLQVATSNGVAEQQERDLKLQMAEKTVQDLMLKNKKLELDLVEIKNSKDAGKISETIGVNNNSKSDNEAFLDNQIQFLNSIIVDMRKKNEELQIKVEALEGGAVTTDLFSATIKRAPAPRMYCDICEIFDSHETEDCPTQDDPDQPPIQNEIKTRVLPTPRPYCEICEEFGHESENCTAEETY